MKDNYGRTIDYLRISLTDKCNLRCKYCMPSCGVNSLPHNEILTLEEVERIVRIMAGLGVTRVRLTGGEPLVKRNVVGLISSLKQVDGIDRISMTTNGTLLCDNIDELKKAGLNDINISLDTLNRDNYIKLTGSDMLDSVLEAIDTAYLKGLTPKINCVPMAEWNKDELTSIALLAKDRNIDVRFIELMPTSEGKNYTRISNDKVLKKLEEVFGESEKWNKDDVNSGPAQYYYFDGFKGRIGLISPVSHSFCKECNRVRLTSTGELKLCLHHNVGTDIKTLMRSGASDQEIKEAIIEAIKLKPKEHNMLEKKDKINMYKIGG